MGFFDRFKRKPPRTCVDPTFGTLKYERGKWCGHAPFLPTGGEVQVLLLESDGTVPSELYGRLFGELVQRYPSLRPAIGAALFELWEPWLAEWDRSAWPR